MRRPSPVGRAAAAVLLVAWLAALASPAPGSAAEDEAAAQDETAAEQPAPVEAHWYVPVVHNANVGIDLIVIRPLAAVTLATGAVLFVPAVLMTAPNGWESMKDAYQRFVGEPGEYFYSRPLGEF